MDRKSEVKVAAIVGVGPGLGTSLAKRFSQAYSVALIARSQDYLIKLEHELNSSGAKALAVTADVTDPNQVDRAFQEIERQLGWVQVLIYNAGNAVFGTIREISAKDFEANWRVCTFGAFLCVKRTIDKMLEQGRGVILFTGATAGVKAGPRSAAFGPAKFALRGFAQSLARDLGPHGVHVAYINIDGMIDEPRVRARFPTVSDEDLLKPDAIAETYWHLAHQDKSAWTMETELRPFKEKF